MVWKGLKKEENFGMNVMNWMKEKIYQRENEKFCFLFFKAQKFKFIRSIKNNKKEAAVLLLRRGYCDMVLG